MPDKLHSVPFEKLFSLPPGVREAAMLSLVRGAAAPAIDAPISGCGDLLKHGRLSRRETPDGTEIWQVEKSVQIKIDALDADGTIEIIASDETVDRYGDVIQADGWDLTAYRENPVLLVDHNYRVSQIVGTTVEATTTDGALRIRARLDPEGGNATADMVRSKLAAGSLRSVSVGFIPKRWEAIRDDDGNWLGIRFLEQELLEVSFVAVPANPAALVQPAAASVVGQNAGVRNMSGQQAAPGTPAEIRDLAEAQRLAAEQTEKLARQMTELADRGDSTSKWIRDIEQRLQDFRGRGCSTAIGSTDSLRDAIPERFRELTPRFASHRKEAFRKDPILANGMSTWLKLAGQLQLRSFGRKHGQVAEELDKLTLALNGGFEVKAAMQEDTDAEGGYTVPSPVEGSVLRALEDVATVRPLVRTIVMNTKTLDWPGGDNAVTAAIIAEEGTITEANETFTQRQLIAKKFCAIGTTSLELVQDSGIDILDYYLELAMEQIALLEDDEALEGDGTYFTGVIGASGVNSVTAAATVAGLALDLASTKFKGGKASRRRASWIMHSQMAGYLAGVSHTDGRPLLNTVDAGLILAMQGLGGNVPGIPEGSILGNPVFTSDEIAVSAAAPDLTNLYYGNWQGVIFGDRTGTEFAVSEHTKFTTAQLQPRVIKRTAILVGVPGYLTKLVGERAE